MLDDNLAGYRNQEEPRSPLEEIPGAEHLMSLVNVGRQTRMDLRDENSPIRNAMERIRDEANAEMSAFVQVDLYSEAGIETARLMQSKILRYLDLRDRVEEMLMEADAAAAQLRDAFTGDDPDEAQQ